MQCILWKVVNDKDTFDINSIDTELVLTMYNAHPYFSFSNLGKNVHRKI